MKKKAFILTLLASLLIVVMLAISGCTDNQSTKFYGGKMTINLPKGQKLINTTWKDTELWYLTRTMTDKEQAENYSFKEKSTFGMMEGEVTFVESK
jgi:uncharacterized lipoprotein YehR (DUF1307 family)